MTNTKSMSMCANHVKTIENNGGYHYAVSHVVTSMKSLSILGKHSVPFRELPLLTVFVMRKKKANVLAQKTSNRKYVLLDTLEAERADKDLMVVPLNHETVVHGISEVVDEV